MSRHRSPGLSRVEVGAQARRRRAMAHIEKVRNDRQQRRLPVRRAAVLMAAASLTAGLLANAIGSSEGPIDRLWVVGAERVTGQEIAAAAGLPGAAAPEAIDAVALAERLEGHAWIDSARVIVMPNGTVVVGVTEREPAALLEGEPRWAIDAQGVPFAPAAGDGLEGLLVVDATERPAPGRADADLARALHVAEDLARLGLPAPTRVVIAAPDDPEGLSLVLPGVTARVVLGRENLAARLADLARLLESGLPELEGAARIDLRFEDQAVFEVEPSLEGAEQAAVLRGRAVPSNSRQAG